MSASVSTDVPPLLDDEAAAYAAEFTPPPAPVLPFYSPVELAAMTLVEPDWVVRPGLVAIGSITEVDGKVKSAGKTTLILHMVRAVLDGAPFLGAKTRRSRVIYVTEQSRQTFADALRRAGLETREDEFRSLFRQDIGTTPWADVVASTKQDGYDVVVFDTIAKLARIKDENSAGEWAAAMEPLQDLAAGGRAVIVARHDRKGGGEVGDTGRGSSQASGDVDIILGVRRPTGNQPPNRRLIESLSRYPDTPEKVIVELTDQGYRLLGTAEAVAANDALEFVSACLDAEFRQTGGGLTIGELEKLGSVCDPVVKRTSIQAAIKALDKAGAIVKSGAGKANAPFVYTLSPPASAKGSPESAETRMYSGRQTSEPHNRLNGSAP